MYVFTKGYIPAISDSTTVVQLFTAKQFILEMSVPPEVSSPLWQMRATAMSHPSIRQTEAEAGGQMPYNWQTIARPPSSRLDWQCLIFWRWRSILEPLNYTPGPLGHDFNISQRREQASRSQHGFGFVSVASGQEEAARKNLTIEPSLWYGTEWKGISLLQKYSGGCVTEWEKKGGKLHPCLYDFSHCPKHFHCSCLSFTIFNYS